MNYRPLRYRPQTPMKTASAVLVAALVGSVLSLLPTIAPTANAAERAGLIDTFDGARDADPTYGLNDSLATRQSGSGRGATYTRVHGDSNGPNVAPHPIYSQVNSSNYSGKLSFWIKNSAVQLDSPILTDATDSYSVSAMLDPNTNSLGNDADWSSMMLSKVNDSSGYVADQGIALGLTVRKNGNVALFSAGNVIWDSGAALAARAANGFNASVTVRNASTATPSVQIAVNGLTHTVSLTSSLEQPRLYLGAYISNGSTTAPYGEVSTVDNLTVSRVAQFTDSFDTATDAEPDYGLNNNLAARQAQQANLEYTRVAGTWDNPATPPSNSSQVNNQSFPNVLSFWVRNSAIRLNAPVQRDSNDAFEIRATLNPDPGQFGTPGDWSSLILSSSDASTGYIEDNRNQFGLTIGRNGDIDVFKNGAHLGSRFTVSPSATGFKATVNVTAASSSNPTVTVTVNGTSRDFQLGAALAKPYLYLGAYLSNGSATAPYKEVSTVDNLAVSRVDPYPNLDYYGTYGTRNDHGQGNNHIGDMTGISNAHWANISTKRDSYDVSELSSCAPKSCIIYVGNEFFDSETSAREPNLDRWNRFVAAIQPYKDKILGYYLKDEPYYRGISAADLEWSANAVKASIDSGMLTKQPILLTLTLDSITQWVKVPSAVDWLGMDAYSMDLAQMERAALRLDEMSAISGAQRTYMFPPNVPDVWNGFTTEAQILQKEKEYLAVANRHPKIVALLNFGLWVYPGAGSHVQSQSDVPNVFAFQEKVGAAIMTKP